MILSFSVHILPTYSINLFNTSTFMKNIWFLKGGEGCKNMKVNIITAFV